MHGVVLAEYIHYYEQSPEHQSRHVVPVRSRLFDYSGVTFGSPSLPLSLPSSLTPSLFPILALGAAYGTAKSGTGIAAMSVMRPDLIMKSVIPVVMAGIIAIYGLVVAVLIANKR